MHTFTSRCALALGFSLLLSACRSTPPSEWGGGARALEDSPRLEPASSAQAAPGEALSTPEDATLEFYLELAMRESHRLRAAH